jgi:rsbT co-antagonist protein RsbR
MSAEDDYSTQNAPENPPTSAASGLPSEPDPASVEQGRRLEQLVADLQSQSSILRATLDGIADGVLVADETGRFTHVNAAAQPFMKLSEEPDPSTEWRKASGFFRSDGVTPYPPEEHPIARAMRGESVDNEVIFLRTSRMTEGMWLHTSARPVYTEDKVFRGAVGIFRDISEQRRWQQEMAQQLVREREKNDLLERMRSAIEQLSTPILEVWDEVLAVPVIGVVDSTRAADMMERVLEAVERKQCRFLIIDITGVDVIDTGTADRFLKLVAAVELLGARCFLTGVRAAVAQTLVSLGMDLKGLTALRTLRHALIECIRAMDQPAPRPQLPQLKDGALRTGPSRA